MTVPICTCGVCTGTPIQREVAQQSFDPTLLTGPVELYADGGASIHVRMRDDGISWDYLVSRPSLGSLVTWYRANRDKLISPSQ